MSEGRVISLGDNYGDGGTDEQRSKARAMVEKWRPVLFLQAYTIHIRHAAEPCSDEVRTNADCSLLGEYHNATITIYPKFWDELVSDEEREFFLLHELCHAVTHKQKALSFDCLNEKLVRSSEIKDADERATDWMAKIVWHLAEVKPAALQ